MQKFLPQSLSQSYGNRCYLKILANISVAIALKRADIHFDIIRKKRKRK